MVWIQSHSASTLLAICITFAPESTVGMKITTNHEQGERDTGVFRDFQ